MSETEILHISASLCERGLLRCIGIEDETPRYELTPRGWIALLMLDEREGR
jgi:hypothetical protein